MNILYLNLLLLEWLIYLDPVGLVWKMRTLFKLYKFYMLNMYVKSGTNSTWNEIFERYFSTWFLRDKSTREKSFPCVTKNVNLQNYCNVSTQFFYIIFNHHHGTNFVHTLFFSLQCSLNDQTTQTYKTIPYQYR